MEDFIPSFENRIQHYLSRPGYVPLNQHELAKALGLDGADRTVFRRQLREMERQGRIVRLRKNRWALPVGGRETTGTIRIHPRGFGFVLPETSGLPDIYIPEDQLGTALDGDRVLVSYEPSASPGKTRRSGGSSKEKEEPALRGKVLRVVDHRRNCVAGHLKRSRYYWYVIPDNPRIAQSVRVREQTHPSPPLIENHKVALKLDPWTARSEPLTGVVTEDLGEAGAPGVDVRCVLHGMGLSETFSDPSLKEVSSHAPGVPPMLLRGRRDLRTAAIITIDPEDAKDYDDAISLEQTAGGSWKLAVHIADVAHYVPQGSAVDEEARHRGNSVYLVDRTLTMLPPRLTSDICSLAPDADRLTHSVELILDANARVVSSETFPSVIRSRARLNYEQVQSFFDGRGNHDIPPAVLPMLSDMRELAQTLRRMRRMAGSMDLSMPEIRCVLDPSGRALAFHKRTSYEAYHLVEEFMLLANTAVAEKLSAANYPSLYRIHDAPDEAQWEQMARELRALGLEDIPADKDGINALAEKVSGLPLEYAATLAILRNMKRALYWPGPKEHFGLGFACYTHFTSPIRRYPDLVVHRVLQALEQGRPPPYAEDDLPILAAHCSQTEQQADEAEEESVLVKRLAYYGALLENGDTGPFDAIITGMASAGLMVQIPETLQRGLIPFRSLTDDRYDADPGRCTATGRRRRNKWSIGQSIRVRLNGVDRSQRLVRFRLDPGEARPSNARKKGRQRPANESCK